VRSRRVGNYTRGYAYARAGGAGVAAALMNEAHDAAIAEDRARTRAWFVEVMRRGSEVEAAAHRDLVRDLVALVDRLWVR
jgi:hypothetical protein